MEGGAMLSTNGPEYNIAINHDEEDLACSAPHTNEGFLALHIGEYMLLILS